MKPGIAIWPYAASIAVHVAALAAVSWLSGDAYAPRSERPEFMEVALVQNSPAAIQRGKAAAPEPEPPGAVDSTPAQDERSPKPSDAAAPTPESDEAFERESRPVPAKRRAATGRDSKPSQPVASRVPVRPMQPSVPGAKPEPLNDEGKPAAAQQVGPSVARLVHPEYPRTARRRGHEGCVVVEATILDSGNVEQVVIAQSSGWVELDRAARRAAERSRFEPATLAGGPVTSTKEITFRFVLDDSN